MKYNINQDQIIPEEDCETQQSRCGSPSIPVIPTSSKLEISYLLFHLGKKSTELI